MDYQLKEDNGPKLDKIIKLLEGLNEKCLDIQYAKTAIQNIEKEIEEIKSGINNLTID